jgi:hypothetical protein
MVPFCGGSGNALLGMSLHKATSEQTSQRPWSPSKDCVLHFTYATQCNHSAYIPFCG